MADKKVKAVVKMLIKAGAANPAPPVGSTLGPYGLNLMAFCKEFNDATTGMVGMVPVIVTIFEDRTYKILLKTPPVAELVKQKLKIQKGAGHQLKETVGTLTEADIREIAEKKMPDLNCYTVEQGMQMVKGTCRNMGVKVVAA